MADLIKLNDAQRQHVLTVVKDEMEKIQQEYDDFRLNEKLEAARKEYEQEPEEGVDFPITDASVRKYGLLTMVSDIVASRGIRQTETPSPICQLELDEVLREGLKESDIRDREDRLDFIMRHDVNLDRANVYRRGFNEGTSIVNTCPDSNIDFWVVEEEYDKKAYENKYRSEIIIPGSKKRKKWESTPEKGMIKEQAYKEKPFRAKPYRVSLDKFFARLWIKDFAKHRVIAEKMDFVWGDIQVRGERGFYDQEAVEELKDKAGKQHLTEDYEVYQAIVLCNPDEYKDATAEDMDDAKQQRYIVTFEGRHEIVLRMIKYPYKHNRIYYVPYSAMPRDDSWLGYMAYMRARPMTEAFDAFINSTLNEFSMAHARTIACTDPTFDASRNSVDVTGKGINILKFKVGTEFAPFKIDYPPTDRMPFIQFIRSYFEVFMGVNASLLSGQETPGDTNAPYAKAALKQQNSNMRIQDLILELQKGDSELFEQVDKLYLQYDPKEVYVKNGKEVKLNKGAYDVKCRYVIQGSRMPFDKGQDLSIVLQTMAILAKAYPAVWQHVTVQKVFLDSILNNSEGTVERKKKEIMAPIEQAVKVFEEQLKAIQFYQQKQGGPGLPPNMQPGGGQPPQMPGPGAQQPPQALPAAPQQAQVPAEAMPGGVQ